MNRRDLLLAILAAPAAAGGLTLQKRDHVERKKPPITGTELFRLVEQRRQEALQHLGGNLVKDWEHRD